MFCRALIVLFLLVLWAVPSSAAPLLTISVEADPSDPAYIDAHSIFALGTGQIAHISIYAVFGGTNGDNTDDGLLGTVYGSLKSGVDDMLCNLSFTPAAIVSASGYQAGTVKDLDADGDLDIGNTPANSQVPTDWIILMSGANTLAPAGAGDRLLLGTAVCTVTSDFRSLTSISWVYRNKTGLGNAINAIKVDGVNYTLAGDDSRLAAVPVRFVSPEPGSLLVLAFGAAGLLRQRRNGKNRRCRMAESHV